MSKPISVVQADAGRDVYGPADLPTPEGKTEEMIFAKWRDIEIKQRQGVQSAKNLGDPILNCLQVFCVNIMY